ncbi:MAG: hypothetical protein ACYS76_13035 [Planctomycetota bacterium]|jgi:hypothetical protein
MISPRTCQLAVALTLACIWIPALSTEPNGARTGLKFEISETELNWMVGKGSVETGHGGIRPTHAAALYIRYAQDLPDFYSPAGQRSILSTASGKLLSQRQVDLLSTGTNCIARLGRFGQELNNHYHFRLYAVSEEDARKTAEAFIQFMTQAANEKAQPSKETLSDLEARVSRSKSELPQAEADAKDAQAQLAKFRKQGRFLSMKQKQAEDTTGELNRMLITLDIEIAGIQAMLSAIEQYRSDEGASNKATVGQLEEIQREQTVKLAGALAKKEKAEAALKEAAEYYNLSRASKRADYLRQNIRTLEMNINQFKARLACPEMLPPMVFQNKVTIYPVRVEE